MALPGHRPRIPERAITSVVTTDSALIMNGSGADEADFGKPDTAEGRALARVGAHGL